MDEEAVIHIFSGILLSHKKVLRRWMNLETVIQSEVSQKEKYKYHILMHIYCEFIFRAAKEKEAQRTDLWTWEDGRRERLKCMERVTWTFIIPYVK